MKGDEKSREQAACMVANVLARPDLEEVVRGAYVAFLNSLPRDMAPVEIIVYAALVLGISEDATAAFMAAHHAGGPRAHDRIAQHLGDVALARARGEKPAGSPILLAQVPS